MNAHVWVKYFVSFWVLCFSAELLSQQLSTEPKIEVKADLSAGLFFDKPLPFDVPFFIVGDVTENVNYVRIKYFYSDQYVKYSTPWTRESNSQKTFRVRLDPLKPYKNYTFEFNFESTKTLVVVRDKLKNPIPSLDKLINPITSLPAGVESEVVFIVYDGNEPDTSFNGLANITLGSHTIKPGQVLFEDGQSQKLKITIGSDNGSSQKNILKVANLLFPNYKAELDGFNVTASPETKVHDFLVTGTNNSPIGLQATDQEVKIRITAIDEHNNKIISFFGEVEIAILQNDVPNIAATSLKAGSKSGNFSTGSIDFDKIKFITGGYNFSVQVKGPGGKIGKSNLFHVFPNPLPADNLAFLKSKILTVENKNGNPENFSTQYFYETSPEKKPEAQANILKKIEGVSTPTGKDYFNVDVGFGWNNVNIASKDDFFSFYSALHIFTTPLTNETSVRDYGKIGYSSWLKFRKRFSLFAGLAAFRLSGSDDFDGIFSGKTVMLGVSYKNPLTFTRWRSLDNMKFNFGRVFYKQKGTDENRNKTEWFMGLSVPFDFKSALGPIAALLDGK